MLALLLFGTAFGYLEAAVVSYLRLLHEPARQQFYRGRSRAELFLFSRWSSCAHQVRSNPKRSLSRSGGKPRLL